MAITLENHRRELTRVLLVKFLQAKHEANKCLVMIISGLSIFKAVFGIFTRIQ